MRLILSKIDGWWYIIHTSRMKYFHLRYYSESQAKKAVEYLKESWAKTEGLEDHHVKEIFNVGYGECVPSHMETIK